MDHQSATPAVATAAATETQVSVETVDGLTQMLSALPVLSRSAVAALMLLKRARSREAGSTPSKLAEPRRD